MKKSGPEDLSSLRKGSVTRQRVIQQAAAVLNVKGYAGTAMSDLMAATGLQKGGLYRHFATKEDLALEALRYTLTEAERVKFWEADTDLDADSIDRLKAFVQNFIANASPVAGGCPVLNASVEYDDNPVFRQEAADTVSRWIARLADIVREGQNDGTIRRQIEPESLSLTILATLEGAQALSRLLPGNAVQKQIEQSLEELLESYRENDPARLYQESTAIMPE